MSDPDTLAAQLDGHSVRTVIASESGKGPHRQIEVVVSLSAANLPATVLYRVRNGHKKWVCHSLREACHLFYEET